MLEKSPRKKMAFVSMIYAVLAIAVFYSLFFWEVMKLNRRDAPLDEELYSRERQPA